MVESVLYWNLSGNTETVRSGDLGTSRNYTDGNGAVANWRMETNAILRQAIDSERARKWKTAETTYPILHGLIEKITPTSSQDRPAWLTMLLFELHYHWGVALQKMSQHSKAIEKFSNAIEAILIPRNGCYLTRCRQINCLLTPIYTRRAVAFAIEDKLMNAIADSDKAVMLDSENADVYCVRAFVYYIADKKRATSIEQPKQNLPVMMRTDLSMALKLRPGHQCATILLNFIAEKAEGPGMTANNHKNSSADGVKMAQNGKEIIEFYEKYLYSLSVPHTIEQIDLHLDPPGSSHPDPSSLRVTRNTSAYSLRTTSGYSNRTRSGYSIRTGSSSRMGGSSKIIPGVVSLHKVPFKTGQTRIHELTSEPRSRESPTCAEAAGLERIATSRHVQSQIDPRLSMDLRKAYGNLVSSAKVNPRNPCVVELSVTPTSHFKSFPRSGRLTDSQAMQYIKQRVADDARSIQVFQQVNTSTAPRFYSRSWSMR